MAGGDRGLSRTASSLTLWCAALAGGLLLAMGGSEGQGAGALWLMFPLLIAAGAHLFLGPVALICALLSRRFWVNAWVYAYFLIVPASMVVILRGGSPAEALGSMVRETTASVVESYQRPREVALCSGLAEELRAQVSGTIPAARAASTLAADFDVSFRCRDREPRLPRGMRELYRATLVGTAVAAGQPDLVGVLLARGAGIDRARTDGESMLYLALEHGRRRASRAGLGGEEHQMARTRRIVTALLNAGAAPDARRDDGYGALHLAVSAGDEGSVALLLEAGADPDSAAYGGKTTPASIAIEAVRSKERQYALSPAWQGVPARIREVEAFRERRRRIVARLLAAGAEAAPILELAVRHATPWVWPEVVAAGHDPRVALRGRLRALLGEALRNRDDETVELLLHAGANAAPSTDRREPAPALE